MNVIKDGNHTHHKGLVITWLHHHLVEVPPRQHPLHTNLCYARQQRTKILISHHPLDHNVILLLSSSQLHCPGYGVFFYLRCNMACSVFYGTRSLSKRSSHLIVPVPVSPLRFQSDLNITLHAEDRLRILQAENQLARFTIVCQISSPPVVNTQRLNNAFL